MPHSAPNPLGAACAAESRLMPSARATDAPYVLPPGNVLIAFSGGRTSAYMLHQILEANGNLPERVVVSFQNTGREMPQTLDFVQEVGERWGVPIVWLEYRHTAPLFEVVNYSNAAREGEPFEALIKTKNFLPNVVSRYCTAELKQRTASRYLRSIGWDYWTATMGIRADEPKRIRPEGVKNRERWTAWQPLASAGVTKQDVTAFWHAQPFDLRLPNLNGKTLLGNCDGCFLKSEANLAALARDYPDRHQWWQDMEDMMAHRTIGNGGKFNREYSRRQLRWSVDNQHELFDTEDGFCQADGGECM